MDRAEIRNLKLKISIFHFLLSIFLLSACDSELIRQQEKQILQHQEEIARQRHEIEELKLAKQREEQKRRDCNRAFRDFEKGQAAKDPQDAVALYRQGLGLCPDDDVAHYELGKILRGMGRTQEGEEEFEAALRINPDFRDAKRQLETIKNRSRD
ncbi:MAG: tetratricopeptide repeat protein [Deltaproteobacteria bacterium]|nr:tetratricopeptide repeat protein [Deltaproteobacteria bacterium]